MGVFGAGIFADDDARDLREDYPHILADAQSDARATEIAARIFGANFDNPAETTAFWLALAWTQWKMGRLDPRAKAIALRVIDEGLDISKWEGSPLRAKRAKALAEARAKITAASPPARPMPKPLPKQLTELQVNEFVAVRLDNGRVALLHVLGWKRSGWFNVKGPCVSVFNWTGAELPSESDLEGLTYINWHTVYRGGNTFNLAAPKKSQIPLSRFVRLGVVRPPTDGEIAVTYGIDFRRGETLDSMLTDVLSPFWTPPIPPAHMPLFGASTAPG
jgi:hypothetical protein